jgi:hypothetical protein
MLGRLTGAPGPAHSTRLVLACVIGSMAAAAQQPSTPGPQPATSATVQAAAPEQPISLPQLAGNVLKDQKPIFTFPAKVVQGKHWKPVLGVALGTAVLVLLDPYTEPYFHDSSGFSSYKTGPLRGRNTTPAITMTPVAFYLGGLLEHSPHARNTGLPAPKQSPTRRS